MPKKFTLIFDYDDFLQQKKRPPILAQLQISVAYFCSIGLYFLV